jgi:glycosyltransferase involved in cell wall biosynthesis
MNSEKKRIIQLISSVNLGGAENIAFNIAEQCKLRNDNLEFTIAEVYRSKNSYALHKKKELAEKQIEVKTLFRGSKRLSLLFAPFTLFNFIRSHKPDTIHSHTDIPDFVLSVALRLLKLFGIKGPRIIRTIHNTVLWPTHNLFGKIAESGFNDDVIVGVSDASVAAYTQIRKRNRLPISEQRFVIYNGCRIPAKEDLGININKSKMNVAFCGRFEYQKGIDILIEKLPLLNELFSEKIDFYFIGSGHYQQNLKEAAKRFDNVKVYSPIDNIANKLHEFDFLLMPSRFEGLVLISIEASLAGVPVISSGVKGLVETLPADWELNFDLNNEKSIVEVLKRIIDGNYNITELKDKSYRFVSSKFSFEKMIDSYLGIYN